MKCHKFHFVDVCMLRLVRTNHLQLYDVLLLFYLSFHSFYVEKPERFNKVKHLAVVVVSVIARPEKKRKYREHTAQCTHTHPNYNGIMLHFDIRDLICVSFCRSFRHRSSNSREKNTCIKSLLFINLSTS